MKTKMYIVHGWAYETEKWSTFIDLLKKEGFDPILLNVPGLTKPLSKVWGLKDYVDWLDREIREEKVILLGHSYGGRITLEYSRLHPKKVSHLILIDSAGVYHNELPIRLKRGFFKFLAKTGKRFTDSDLLRDLLYKFAREKDYKEANPHMKQTMVNLINSDKGREIDGIETPTTIIWGEKDMITPVSDAHYFREHLSNSTLYVVGESGHSPHFTHPEKVTEIIKQFSNVVMKQ